MVNDRNLMVLQQLLLGSGCLVKVVCYCCWKTCLGQLRSVVYVADFFGFNHPKACRFLSTKNSATGWLMGKPTGTPYNWWFKQGFPVTVDFLFNQPSEQ